MSKAMLLSKAQEALFIAIFIFSSLSQLAIVEPRQHFSSPRPHPHGLPHQHPHPHPYPSFDHLNQKQGFSLSIGHHQNVMRPGSAATSQGRLSIGQQQNVMKPISASTKQGWLAAHNKVREAMGEPPMKWNNSLARYARRFAATRIYDCLMIHSDGPHGENIFWAARNVYTPAQIVAKWVDEQHNYNRTGNLCAANKVCGHYKQVVWRDSLKVGCALVQCLNGGAYAICSYDPPGNYKGEDPFTKHV